MTTPTNDFDSALVAARRGDEAGFTVVFRATQPALLGYLRTLAGQVAAEDLAAETWVAALRGLGRFEGGERAFVAWLMVIARARWVDWLRARGRRPELVTDVLPELQASDDVASGFEESINTDAALRLIESLPPDQAEVIALRFITGMDVAAVAVVVGKSPNHVRVLAHRGLRRLAERLTASPEQAL